MILIFGMVHEIGNCSKRKMKITCFRKVEINVMNYFTKGWYDLCQKTSAHLLLEEDEQAESFSEEYFQQLYNQKLTEYLNSWEEVANISHEPFNREIICKQFEEAFIYNQEHMKKILSEEILKMIADIRVYVLDKTSRQVINEVTRFCEENEKSVYRTIKKYDKYYKKSLESFDKDMVENIQFHDCLIIDIKETEQSLSILFDNSGGFTDICEMKFENYKLLKQDAPLQNSWWLYDEIYKISGKYELQVLLQDNNSNIVEFSISAEHFAFKHNEQK
jgi:hypothetical protein